MNFTHSTNKDISFYEMSMILLIVNIIDRNKNGHFSHGSSKIGIITKKYYPTRMIFNLYAERMEMSQMFCFKYLKKNKTKQN